MRIKITPILLEELRKVRVGIWDVSEEYIFKCFLSSKKVRSSFETIRTRVMQHLVKIGRKEAMKYCWALGTRELYHRAYTLEQVEKNPFRFFYRVFDEYTGQYVNVSTITAFRCFRISEKWRYLFWDVYASNAENVIEIDGLEIELLTRVDAIQFLSSFYFESTSQEPIFFNYWERIDWKLNGLLLPELHTANITVFQFGKSASLSDSKEYFYPMYYDEGTRADALEELELFARWIKTQPELLEQLSLRKTQKTYLNAMFDFKTTINNQ